MLVGEGKAVKFRTDREGKAASLKVNIGGKPLNMPLHTVIIQYLIK